LAGAREHPDMNANAKNATMIPVGGRPDFMGLSRLSKGENIGVPRGNVVKIIQPKWEGGCSFTLPELTQDSHCPLKKLPGYENHPSRPSN